MKRILVIGSINMDMVIKSPRIPERGETVLGQTFATIPGGKGANQARALAQQGASVFFTGAVGNDEFGTQMLRQMKDAGINCENVKTVQGEATGIAAILLENRGDNRIIVIAGANSRVSETDADRSFAGQGEYDAAVLQLEIPAETVFHTIREARARNIPVFLNAAPARSIPDSILARIDCLIVNETELALLSGIPVSDAGSGKLAADILRGKGARTVVLTLGAQGCAAYTDEGDFTAPAVPVSVVDTTAAGDSFIGGFVTHYLETGDMYGSLVYGNVCGALAASKYGAQSSIPSKAEAEEKLRSC